MNYYSAGYPDLAVGASYKALLLCDAVEDEAEEYHEQATASLEHVLSLQEPGERQQIADWTEANASNIDSKSPLSIAIYYKATM